MNKIPHSLVLLANHQDQPCTRRDRDTKPMSQAKDYQCNKKYWKLCIILYKQEPRSAPFLAHCGKCEAMTNQSKLAQHLQRPAQLSLTCILSWQRQRLPPPLSATWHTTNYFLKQASRSTTCSWSQISS